MTPRARAAFRIYRDLGPGRTLRQVTELLGKRSPSTVRGWSARYDWADLVAEHDHAQLREAFGQREIVKERALQTLIDRMHEAAETLYAIMTDDKSVPILDRHGEIALDENGEPLQRPTVKASTRLEAAKTLLGLAGLVPVKRTEHVDKTAEQLDQAAAVLRTCSPEQLEAFMEILGSGDDDND